MEQLKIPTYEQASNPTLPLEQIRRNFLTDIGLVKATSQYEADSIAKEYKLKNEKSSS